MADFIKAFIKIYAGIGIEFDDLMGGDVNVNESPFILRSRGIHGGPAMFTRDLWVTSFFRCEFDLLKLPPFIASLFKGSFSLNQFISV